MGLTDMDVALQDVHIRFPANPGHRPAVQSAEPGTAEYESGAANVHWHIPVLDSTEANGNMEFTAACDASSLMPFTFQAVRKDQTKCPVNIIECYHQERGEQIGFVCNKACIYELTIGK